MRLTAYTDYTLRVLMYLGLKGDARATIKEISDCYGISKNHLMKIVQDLSREGVLNTVRGKSGGIRLARHAEAICTGDVVRMTEPDFRIVESFGAGEPNYRLYGTCVFPTTNNEATDDSTAVPTAYTRAALTRQTQSRTR